MADITPRRLILTLYGLYAREEHNWLSVRSVVKLMEELGTDSASVRSSISRLKRRDVLQARKVGTSAGYSLSDDALALLREGDVRIFGPRRATVADGLVMVVFSVPESERERRHQLRSVLSGLGFGTVSPGLWVAPSVLHDETVRMLQHRNLAPYVEVFRATYENFATFADRVGRWWDLDSIQAAYRDFIATFESVRATWGSSSKEPRDAFGEYVPMLTAWRRLPYLDPGLPLSVLPPDWSGSRANELFADLEAQLKQPARLHALGVIHG